MKLYDPTYRIQPDAPHPIIQATVIAGLGDDIYRVRFNGREWTARSAGGKKLSPGDRCSFVQGETQNWVIKASAAYPSHYRRRLSTIFKSAPSSAFLLLIQQRNNRSYRYREASITSILSSSTIIATIANGRAITCHVEYGDDTVNTGSLSIGDRILIYQKTANNWVAIANTGTIEITVGYVPLGIWQNPDGTITVIGWYSGTVDHYLFVYDNNLALSWSLLLPAGYSPDKAVVYGTKIAIFDSTTNEGHYSADLGSTWTRYDVCDYNIDSSENVIALTSKVDPSLTFSDMFLENPITSIVSWQAHPGYCFAAYNQYSGDAVFPSTSNARIVYPSALSFDPLADSKLCYVPCEGTTTSRENDYWVVENRIWQAGVGGKNLSMPGSYNAITKAIYTGDDIISGYYNDVNGSEVSIFDGSSSRLISLPSPYTGLTAKYPAIDFDGGIYYYIDDGGTKKIVRFPAGTTF